MCQARDFREASLPTYVADPPRTLKLTNQSPKAHCDDFNREPINCVFRICELHESH